MIQLVVQSWWGKRRSEVPCLRLTDVTGTPSRRPLPINSFISGLSMSNFRPGDPALSDGLGDVALRSPDDAPSTRKAPTVALIRDESDPILVVKFVL